MLNTFQVLDRTKWEHFQCSRIPDWSSPNLMFWANVRDAETTQQDAARLCLIMHGWIGLSHFAVDQSDASSVPFSLPVTFPHTANLQTLLIRRSPSLSLIVPLSLSKSPSKSYRGNSQQKINMCLVNSLTTIKDTVSLLIKALMETIYAAEEEAPRKSLWISFFHHFALAAKFLENDFTTLTQPHTGPMSAVNGVSPSSQPFLSAKLGGEVTLKTSTGLHIDFTPKSGCW